MSVKKIYTCEICKENIVELNDSFGLYFSNNYNFTLGNYGCTDGTHICYRCARQLKEHFNNPQIIKLLSKEATHEA